MITPLICLYFGYVLSQIWRDTASDAKGLLDFPMIHNVPYDLFYNNSLSPIRLTTCLEWYMYDFAAGASSETKEFVKNPKGNDLFSKITQFDCHKEKIKVPYFQKPKEGMTINEEIIQDYYKMNEYPFYIGDDNQMAKIMPDGAVTFYEANDQLLSYGVQISDNQLNEYRRGNGVTKFQVHFKNDTYVIPRVFDGMLGLIDLMSRAYIQKANPDIHLLSGVMHFPSSNDAARYLHKAITLTGSFFYPVALSLLLPIFLASLVLEKEEGIRGMMKMNGLKMKNYWLVHYLWSLLVYYPIVALFWILGAYHLQLNFFIKTNPLILLSVFAAWGHFQIGFAFLLQYPISKSRTATIMGYAFGTILIFCGVCINTGVYIAPTEVPILVRCCPPLAFARILYLFAVACGNDQCLSSFSEIQGELLHCYISLYLGAIIFPIVAMYLEGEKIRVYQSIRSLFKLCFGTPDKEKIISYNELDNHLSVSSNEENEGEDDDCKVTREFAESVVRGNMDQYALVCKGIRKVYDAIDNRPPKTAVKNFSLVIPKGELFGLLGPNGAGKTSLISVLTGLTKSTKGSAWISGINILTNMEDANAKMGVCPQDNFLWPTMTVEEHLEFYSRVKGIPPHLQKSHVSRAISNVALENFAKFQANSLSGGMQRRLSVAISLVGDPDIVFLDEPTTGLDPENRRGLWDILASLRGQIAMILTTHSMEEADVLCNRIGIFKDGGLKCIGPQTRLKKLYGDGYYLNINCFRDMDSYLNSKQKTEDTDASLATNTNLMADIEEMEPYYDKLKSFIRDILPKSELRTAFNGNFCFQIPGEGFKVSSLFKILNSKKEELAIKDWGVSQSSLEEVFLKIANEELTVFDIQS